MRYLTFHEIGLSDSGKTKCIEVRHESGEVLGWIYWYPRWHKYVYHPEPRTVYDDGCLQEISTHLEIFTREHKLKNGMATIA